MKDLLLTGLKNASIPDPAINTDEIPNILGLGFEIAIHVLTFTNGKFQDPSELTLSLSKIQPSSADGEFSIDARLTGNLHFNWHEEHTYMPHGGKSNDLSFDSDFTITLNHVNLTITIKISLDESNNLTLTPKVTHAEVTDKDFDFTVPYQSGFTSNFSCVTKRIHREISDKIGSAIDGMATQIQAKLNDDVDQIPKSGKLTSNITYLFPGTPGGLLFSNDNGVIGIQYRVLGKLQWKGTNAPGDIGSVPFPPVPTDGHDALFYVNNYSFNALFWAFYMQGDLHFSFNKANIPDGVVLNTNVYKDSPLHAIYDKYPDHNMIIDLTLNAAPTIRLRRDEADITYNALVTFFIAKKGSETEEEVELFSVDLVDVDALTNFSVTKNSNSLQLITFRASTSKELSFKVIKSNIPKVDHETISMIWNFALQPVYADILNKAAQSGVPLPSTLGSFFTNYAIRFFPGYASVAVSFTSK